MSHANSFSCIPQGVGIEYGTMNVSKKNTKHFSGKKCLVAKDGAVPRCLLERRGRQQEEHWTEKKKVSAGMEEK